MNATDLQDVRRNIKNATEQMKENGIDTWLILTRENSDPILPFLVGIHSVGKAAIFLRSNGEHIVLTSASDAGSYSATNLFSQVHIYGTAMEKDFMKLWDSMGIKKVALNISEKDNFCDGLTLGQYLWLKETVGESTLKNVEISSENIVEKLKLQSNSPYASSKMFVQHEKVEQISNYLKEEHIDAWIIYSSQSSDPSLSLIPGVPTNDPTIFIFCSDSQSFAICSENDEQIIKNADVFGKVMCYERDLQATLQQLLNELNVKTFALNYSKDEFLADGLTTGRFRLMQKILEPFKNIKVVSSATILAKLRSIKTPKEIEAIQKAVDITMEIYESVYEKLQPGMTEIQAGDLFVDELELRGLVNGIDRTLSRPIVMKENIAHRAPSEAVIEPGDLVIFDFSVDYNGYVSDIARTVYFLKEDETEPPKHIRQVFQTIYEAISLAKEAMKIGVQGWEIDQVARKHYVDNGYPEITHATGHQIGLNVHDGGTLLAPKWERYGEASFGELQSGMVFTIEPTIFMDGGIHFIVEENVVMTTDGAEWLSARQKEIICIPFK